MDRFAHTPSNKDNALNDVLRLDAASKRKDLSALLKLVQATESERDELVKKLEDTQLEIDRIANARHI